MPLRTYGEDSGDLDGATAAALTLIAAEEQAHKIWLAQQDFAHQQEAARKKLEAKAEELREQQTAEAKKFSREAWLEAGGDPAAFERAWPRLREQQLMAIAAASQAGQINWRESDSEIGYVQF